MIPKWVNVVFAVLLLVWGIQNVARHDFVWAVIDFAFVYANVWIYLDKVKKGL